MRVAMLAGMHNALPPFWGGGGQRHLYALAEYFSGNGIECELVSPFPEKHPPNPYQPKKGIRIHYVEAKKGSLPILDEMRYAENTYRKLREINSEKRLDLVHAHASYAGKAGLRFCTEQQIPFAFTQHNWRTWHYRPENLRETIRQWVDRYLVEMPILSKADRVFFVCGFIRDAIKRQTGLAGRDWQIATNGVDLKVFGPKINADGFRKKHGIGEGDFIVCSAGRLSPEKNNRTLIRAFAGFAAGRENCRLFIAGEGEERAILEKLIRGLGLEGRACLTGNLGLGELPMLYSASHVFVLPSLYECMPVALLEAMASNTAVIAGRAGGIPEVIEDGRNGLLMDSATDAAELERKLDLLCNNGKLRRALAKNAMETIRESYSWGKVAEKVLASERAAQKYIINCGGAKGSSVRELRELLKPGEKCLVHTFEPNPVFFPFYRGLKNHVLRPEAAWVSDGKTKLYLQKEDSVLNRRGLGRGHSLLAQKSNIDRSKPIEVPCVDFSRWVMRNFAREDYIILKMDIEGAEYAVLGKMIRDGSIDYISELYVEFHHKRHPEIATEEEYKKIISQLRLLKPKLKINEWK